MPLTLHTHEDIKRALKAFNLLKKLTPGELETLEILSDKNQREILMASLEESKKGKVHSLRPAL